MSEQRIMILEDEAIIAWDIEAELQGRGVTVAGVAGRLDEAMALIDAGGITVAILDINLGHENSYGLARLCRDRDIAVIFLTGDTGDDRPDELKDMAVVSKPVDYSQLMRALDQVSSAEAR